MRRIDLTGMTFGPWKAIEYLGDKRYSCVCTCGVVTTFNTQALKRKVGTCTHVNPENRLKYKFNPGDTIGEWTILGYAGNQRWRCRCSCGKEADILSQHLRYNRTKSCGHSTTAFKDLTHMTFGEWKVIEYAGDGKWLCKCSCGAIRKVGRFDLLSNKSKSCGHDTTAFKDLTGQKIGDWDILKYLGNGYYECLCNCGRLCTVSGRSLRAKTSLSCGHGDYIDLTQKQFGSWTALEYFGDHNWLCQCECGTFRIIPSIRLRKGVTKSCGCKKSENFLDTMHSRYGVCNVSQRHLSEEQLDIQSSREKLLDIIVSLDAPTPKNISNIIGVTPAQVMRIVRKFNLEDFVYLNYPVSSYENEINSLFPCRCRSNKTVLNGKELDLFYPEHNLAVEFNGTYWHSTLKKSQKYHQEKTVAAGKQGVHILHIFEYEWLDSNTQQKLINLLGTYLGKNLKPLHAKDCNIAYIEYAVASEFLDNYHLQNSVKSNINLGCYYNEELIGVMCFGKPRFSKEYQYELLRLCWKPGYVVSGGSNRLLERFKRDYRPESIISYCDISKFKGDSYVKLGFRPIRITSPNYKWVEPYENTVLSRYQTQKQRLIKMGLGTENQTEDDIMSNLGYLKVYDSGNIVFIWNSESQQIIKN